MVQDDQSYGVFSLFGISNDSDLVKTMTLIENNLKAKGFSTDPPKSLYRYRRVEYVMGEIENHYVHLSIVSDLSDPYDSIIPYSSIFEKTGLSVIFGEEQKDDLDLEGALNPITADVIAICCFSEDYRSFPMWDHYTDGYKGVCIEYDGEKLRKYLGLFKVKYSKEAFKDYSIESDSPFENAMSSIIGCILTKNKDYGYEKEWRYFNCTDCEKDIGDSIKRVYIGDRCNVKDTEKIVQLCKDKGIEVIRLKASRTKYEFEEEVLSD